MRARILILATAAFALTGLWMVADSKPGSPEVETADGNREPRSLQLVDAPPAEAAVASDLEAGRPARSPVRGAVLMRIDRAAPPAEPEHNHADMVVATPAQELSQTALATPDVSPRLTLAAAPAAPIFGEARPIPGAGNDGAREPYVYLPASAGREPTIIIRGGSGTAHDDCKIAAPGRMGGSAVNRVAPTPGGGYGRSGAAGGFRGGIR